MRFEYVARDASGQMHRGWIESEDQAGAVQRLGADGLTPVQLTGRDASAARPTTARRGRRIRVADQVMLLQELSTLLGAGVSLGDALPSLAQAYSAHVLGPPLEALHQAVRGGARLSDALKQSRIGLSAHVMALTQAGEASGQLARVLSDAAQHMEFERRVAEDMRSALIYPTVLICAGTLAVMIIFVGVVPRFASLISGAKANVPELSRAIIESGLYVRGHLLQFGLGALALVSLAGFGLANENLRARLLQAMLRVPGIGPWLIQSEIGGWASALGTLLVNRVPIVEAMEISSGVLRLAPLRAGMARATRSLQQGQSLAAALESQLWFPPTRLNLIRVGERSGELPKMLLALGASQIDAARVTQRRLLTLIEPAAILIIGAVIGVIMVAVMMAITSLNTVAL